MLLRKKKKVSWLELWLAVGLSLATLSLFLLLFYAMEDYATGDQVVVVQQGCCSCCCDGYRYKLGDWDER